MKKLSALEAQQMVVRHISHFVQIHTEQMALGKRSGNFYSEIENVGFFDILDLWCKLKTDNKRLFMPGELDNDRITIVYKVAQGCVIQIESEPCYLIKPTMPKFYQLN